MDKYTYNLKTDRIQKLVREKDYGAAAKIADTMDWDQEHNVRLLTSVAEAYEQTGQYKEAIDILLNAYEQAPIGKRIMYKLTELAIEDGNIADAETFYRQYLEEAPDENNRYILRFLIAQAKGEDLDKQILILETYKKYEFEEEWACRLAELYQKAGRRADCVALCDEIILWFGVGPYVDRAKELKEFYEPHTDSRAGRSESSGNGAAAEKEESAEGVLPSIAISEEVAAARLNEEPKPEKRQHSIPETEEEEEKADRIQAILSRAAKEMGQPSPSSETAPRPIIPSEEEPVVISVEEEPVPEPVEIPPAQEPEMSETEDLEKTKDLGENPEWRTVTEAFDAENLDETKEFVPPREYRTAEQPEKTPAPEPAAETAVRTPEPAPAPIPEPAPEPVPAPEPAPVPEPEPAPEPKQEEIVEEPFLKEKEEETSTLESDSSVLPVISFEETEQAVWEEQNRRREEKEPLESYELEHCIFISAANSEDGIDKAVEALEDYYENKGEDLPKIAKIVAEKLNRRGIIHSLPQLNQKDLIIDRAGGLSDEMIGEMLEVLDYLDVNKVFVLVDEPAEVPKLKQRVRSKIIETENEKSSPEEEEEEEESLPKIQISDLDEEPEPEPEPAPEPKPASRRVVRVEKPRSFEELGVRDELSEDDFVRYSDYFAHELECVIDDGGFDALQEEIEAIREEGGRLTVGESQDIIEEAAEHAQKFTFTRMFKSKYDKEGFLILRNRDFL